MELVYHFFVHGMAERLLKTIRRQESIRAGERVAVAVSGGADSVALLCLLVELGAELGVVLSVAHVNHRLRGSESDADQRFVEELARGLGLELHVYQAPAVSNDGHGVEAAARQLRYGFFRELAREGRVTKIATAHTLDDQAETVLLRMFRGTGIRGLSGIHPRIVFEEQGRVFGEVLRPLLRFRRAALQEFLQERGQSWREDSSNLNVAFLRNRVRHRLLPLIAEEFGEAAIEHISELAEIARAEEEHWERGHLEVRAQLAAAEAVISSVALTAQLKPRPFKAKSDKAGSNLESLPQREKRQAVSLPLNLLLTLPLAAQRRLMRGWLVANAPDVSISFRLTEEALELAHGGSGKKQLAAGWNLRVARQGLLLELESPGGQTQVKDVKDYECSLAVPGTVEIPELGARIEARLTRVQDATGDERGQLLDPGQLPKQVLIRNWRAGDRYRPAHMATEKKVKELLNDRHVTGAEKKLWPVAVVDGSGLIWMRGFAVPAAFRAPAGASKAIWIRELRT